MVTCRNIGKGGRFGNQLFTIASTTGIAVKNNKAYTFPEWKYNIYFENGIPETSLFPDDLVLSKEETFHYNPNVFVSNFNSTNLDGYFQSEKYFEDCKAVIKDTFKFKEDYINDVLTNFNVKNKGLIYETRNIAIINRRKIIAISIRRGDFVLNPNYAQLPLTYYILALFENFPNWQDCNIIVFSDDMEYCKVNFGCLDNVYFAEGNSDIEDMCLMSQCDNFIISNSTYSWWGAWLGEKEGTKVIRPNYLFDGELAEKNDMKDYYPERWIVFDHIKEDGAYKRIDLTDTTFIIPVKYDSPDRKENYDLSISYIRKDFDVNICVMEHHQPNEDVPNDKLNFHNNSVPHYLVFESELFHRTKMLNRMTEEASTPYIANWDCDIIIPTLQIWKTVQNLRKGDDMVYPYDGRFARLPRELWHKKLESYLDIGVIQNTIFNGMRETDALDSVGGAVFFNKKSYLEAGGENENFISFGAEDVERKARVEKLGYVVSRVKGCLYHINHFVGNDSTINNPYFKHNREECNKVMRMSKSELIEYINTWEWKTK